MRNRQTTQLLSEMSRSGRRGAVLPNCDVPVPSSDKLLPAAARATSAPPLPELAEPDVVRHYTNLSTLNMSVDTHFYPLGSCTMKYNPRVNELVARTEGLAWAHPYQPESLSQGAMDVIAALESALAEITGMDAVTLQPAAGAHGEYTDIKDFDVERLAADVAVNRAVRTGAPPGPLVEIGSISSSVPAPIMARNARVTRPEASTPRSGSAARNPRTPTSARGPHAAAGAERVAMSAPEEQAYHSTGSLRSAASLSEALIRRHSGSERLPRPWVGSESIATRVMPSGTRSV